MLVGNLTTLAAAIALAACGDDDSLGPDAGIDAMPDAQTCLTPATYPMTLTAGAFPASPDHPSVLVVVPAGFDPTPPIDLFIYIHGFDNCITNVIGETDAACSAGGPIRNAYSLAAQLDASHRNALLVVPEVAFDMASGDPGTLGTAGGFHALLVETLATIPAPLGPLDLSRVGKVAVASHSGGYTAAAGIVSGGGVPIDELWLLDSLYGDTMEFDAWVMTDLADLTTLARRFADVYTTGGGTAANSQAMAARAKMWVDPSVIVDDPTNGTLADTDYGHGLIFKYSALSHDDVPRYYVEHLLATSVFAARTCQ
jgi:hypothetical protein